MPTGPAFSSAFSWDFDRISEFADATFRIEAAEAYIHERAAGIPVVDQQAAQFDGIEAAQRGPIETI